MAPLTKVVTEPLGLVGFVLSLLFAYLAKLKRKDERRWLSPVAAVLAAIALLGGLAIAYSKAARAPSAVPQNAGRERNQRNRVEQVSVGAGSPNVQGVQGNVSITIDQSTSKTDVKAPPEHAPKKTKH